MRKFFFLISFAFMTNAIAMENQVNPQVDNSKNYQQITLADVKPDFFIHIADVKTFGVSELVLRANSPFFLAEIQKAKEQDLTFINVNIERDQIEAFILLLRALHQNIDGQEKVSPVNILKLIYLSTPFQCRANLVEAAVKKLLPANFEDMQKNTREDDQALFMLFHLPGILADLKQNDLYNRLIKIPYFDNYFRSKFPSMSSIAPILTDIPPFALACFLEGTIQTDSENSVVAIIFTWAEMQAPRSENKDIDERKEIIAQTVEPFLDYVDWQNITKHYWNNIVIKLGEFYPSEKLKKILYGTQRPPSGLTANVSVKPRLYEQKIIVDGSTIFLTKFEFGRLSDWEEGGRYHSEPVLKDGYMFYVYLCPQGKSLAWNIRCIGIGQREHCLPTQIKIELLLNDHNVRKFKTGNNEFFDVPFDSFDRPAEFDLNDLDPRKAKDEDEIESWQHIKNGETMLTIGGNIIIFLTVKLPNS